MNEYWIVKETRTGKIIAHCGEEKDAIMLVSFDPHKRTYVRNRLIMDQVIDVTSTTDKQLSGQLGLPSGQVPILNTFKQKLPEGKGIPVKL